MQQVHTQAALPEFVLSNCRNRVILEGAASRSISGQPAASETTHSVAQRGSNGVAAAVTSGSSNEADAGEEDAGEEDAGEADVSEADASEADASEADVSEADAGDAGDARDASDEADGEADDIVNVSTLHTSQDEGETEDEDEDVDADAAKKQAEKRKRYGWYPPPCQHQNAHLK